MEYGSILGSMGVFSGVLEYSLSFFFRKADLSRRVDLGNLKFTVDLGFEKPFGLCLLSE